MRGVLGLVIGMVVVGMSGVPAAAQGENSSPFNGVWALDRQSSELPRDIGFNPAWFPSGDDKAQAPGGGGAAAGGSRRGTAGGGGATLFSGRQESYEEGQRTNALSAEARNPATRLTVIDLSSTVTIVDELGQFRVVHPSGREELVTVNGVAIPATSRREGDRLVIAYRAAPDREVRYTYSYSPGPPRLAIEVQFLENGKGPKVRRVYGPAPTPEPIQNAVPTVPQAPSAAAAPAPVTSAPLDQSPLGELKGVKTVGVVVEDLGAPAAACGLSRDAVESALTKQLTDGGFTVPTRTDNDVYLYVNIMTARPSNDSCVSRYDVFLYTHAPTTLPYRDRPVLVQVQLMHRGGIGSSGTSGHAAAVNRALQTFVDGVISQIRSANN
jgi:hypothetical protein